MPPSRARTRSSTYDLRQRAAILAGAALEIGGKASKGKGAALALNTLADGRARKKFEAICEA